MSPDDRREALRHNTSNAVTGIVARVRGPGGRTSVRKELVRPDRLADPGPWAASTDPRHWNYWRREAELYTADGIRAKLRDAGLDLPDARIEEHADGVTLWLEDVAGTAGPDFSLADHQALAEALGRWQAAGRWEEPWASRGFLRDYSGSRPVRWELVDDDAAWRRPLVRDTWPAGLRAGWPRLLAHRQQLIRLMARLPEVRSHLDFWVSNQIRRPNGRFVLLDWAFAGAGARGEDLGNHVPDAVLDLFWPGDRIAELDHACVDGYLRGLRQAGFTGATDEVRLGVHASCVKYAWLLPRMLERAAQPEQQAYHRVVDPGRLFTERGLALRHLVSWCDQALPHLTG